jgi:AcrR family transcriptional regulator
MSQTLTCPGSLGGRVASTGRNDERAMSTTVNSETHDQIIRAAEELFASRGIDGVSLREINRAAGQSNTGAVQYHFGDRDGLVRALIDKHRRDTEPRRHALLDQYEEAGNDDLRALAAALVSPMAAKLADPDGGRHYLQVSAEFYSRPPRHGKRTPILGPDDSILRWHRLLDPLVPAEELAVLHTRYPAIRFAFVELARRAAADPREDDRLFTSHLTDLVTALLESEASPQTKRLLALREQREAAAN